MLVVKNISNYLEVLINSILIQYFSDSYCISLLSDVNLNLNLTVPFVYLNNSTANVLKQNLFEASESGCADYVIQIEHPGAFLDVYEENLVLNINRKGNRKILFLPVNYHKNHFEELVNVLSLKPVQFLPNVLVIIPQIKDGNVYESISPRFSLFTHQFVGSKDHNKPIMLDIWDPNNLSYVGNNNLFPHDMSDMQGKSLRVAAFTYKPYVLLDLDPEETPGGCDGMEMRIPLEYCKWINCSVMIISDDGEEWGDVFENGTGTGVIGKVVSDQADIAITALYSWYQEFKFLDLSMPEIRTTITTIAPAPMLLSGWWLPLLPFSGQVWAGLGISFAISVIALGAALAVLNRPPRQAVFSIFGTLLSQPSEFSNSWSTRRVIGWVLLASLVLGNAYSSGLASNMTVPKYEKSIDSIQDMVDRKIEWAGTSEAWIYSIMSSDQPILLNLSSQFHILLPEEMRARSTKRDLAYAIEWLPADHYAIGDYITEEALPYLQLMRETFYWEQAVMMARKSSAYTKPYNKFLGRLHSAGLSLAWETQVVLKHSNYKVQLGVKLSRSRHSDYEPTGLDFQHVLGAFIALGIGTILSTITFLLELLWYRKHIIQNKNILQ